MELNETFMDFLEREEGLRLLAYDDKRPNYQLQQGDHVVGRLTIGYGHTGDNVFIGQTISKQEAMDLAVKDLKWATNAVNKFITVPLTQNQFNALVSFTYNCGEGALRTSTLRKILTGDYDADGTQDHKPDYAGVPAQLMRWIYSDGEPMLKGRRERECVLWNTPDGA